MPPAKLYWPTSKTNLIASSPPNRPNIWRCCGNCSPTSFLVCYAAMTIAMAEMKAAANQEDLRRGYRPPGTQIGR